MRCKKITMVIQPDYAKSRDWAHFQAQLTYRANIYKSKKTYSRSRMKRETRKACEW